MLVYVVVNEDREFQNAFFSRHSADLLIEKNHGWEIEPMDTVDTPQEVKKPAAQPGEEAGQRPKIQIDNIANEMERAAKVTEYTDTSVVQCAIEGWARRLRELEVGL